MTMREKIVELRTLLENAPFDPCSNGKAALALRFALRKNAPAFLNALEVAVSAVAACPRCKGRGVVSHLVGEEIETQPCLPCATILEATQ